MMRADLERVCEQHPNRWDCPDALIDHSPKKREYRLIVHDGGRSMITIRFCPWCGTNLASLAKPS